MIWRSFHGRVQALLRVRQHVCLPLVLGCLGTVALGYASARIFQSCQSWRFDRALDHQPSPQKSPWVGWIGQDVSATTTQDAYVFHVSKMEEVGPEYVQVLKNSGRPKLTLITSYPFDDFGPDPQRFVVETWEIQSSQVSKPDHWLASARSTRQSPSEGPSKSSARLEVARLQSPLSPSDAHPTLIAAAVAGSAPATDGSESNRETADAQQVDPRTDLQSTPHKIYRKVRGWLGSIPNRLRLN